MRYGVLRGVAAWVDLIISSSFKIDNNTKCISNNQIKQKAWKKELLVDNDQNKYWRKTHTKLASNPVDQQPSVVHFSM